MVHSHLIGPLLEGCTESVELQLQEALEEVDHLDPFEFRPGYVPWIQMALTALLDVHWQERDEDSASILTPLDLLEITVSLWLGSGSWGWAAVSCRLSLFPWAGPS